LVVAAATVLALNGASSPRPPVNNPSLVLDRFSRVAASQTSFETGPHQFVYVNRYGVHWEPGPYGPRASSPPLFWVSSSYEVQSWESATIEGKTISTTSAGNPARPSDESAWKAAGRPELPGPTTRTSRPGADDALGTDLDVASLSSQPNKLEQQLQQGADSESHKSGHAASNPVDVFSLAHGLLSTWQVQPAVRSALFKVLSSQPGVSAKIGVRNHAGQTGTAISLAQDGVEMQMIFDPRTSEEIGYSSVITDAARAGYPPDAQGLTGWVVISPPVLVDSIGRTS
jgi:hypothetical protein